MASEAAVDQDARSADRPSERLAGPGLSGNRVDVETGTSGGAGRPHRGPRRWKLALLTWLGAYAVVLLVLAVAGPEIADWPLELRALLISGIMVAAMTWVIVPFIMRVFRLWLQR
jgi:hypothetical protein